MESLFLTESERLRQDDERLEDTTPSFNRAEDVAQVADDPYALKGGDPFVKTNKHGHGTDVQVPKGSSPDVKAKLAQIAAAAVAANNADLGEEEQEE